MQQNACHECGANLVPTMLTRPTRMTCTGCTRVWCSRDACRAVWDTHFNGLPYYDDCSMARAAFPQVHAVLVLAKVRRALADADSYISKASAETTSSYGTRGSRG